MEDTSPPNPRILPDTVRVQACLNFGFREEYSELIDILNDPAVTKGKMKVTAVGNDEIKRGNYDAMLIAITGYRSNFLFRSLQCLPARTRSRDLPDQPCHR